MGGKVGNKGIIGDLAGLGKTIHALADFDIYVAVVDERAEVVLVEDGFGDEGNGNHHVLIPVHGGIEVKIFDVHGHELGIGRGEDTVEEKFGGGEASSLGANIARIVDEVSTHSPADTTWLFLLGTISDDVAEVGGTSTFRDLVVADEVDGVGTFGLFVALGQAASFFGT